MVKDGNDVKNSDKTKNNYFTEVNKITTPGKPFLLRR